MTIPQGYGTNFVLLESLNEFKLYILMGTSESGVIPFGNDYLFRTNKKGNITEWKKLYSKMISAHAKGFESAVHFHLHLKTTPYITATDICTFRFYGELCGMEEFGVICASTWKNYKYIDKIFT